MLRNASTNVEKCKHKCWEMQTHMFLYVRWNVEHLKTNANIYVCLRRCNKCKINAVANAVHARMPLYGVYREGLKRAFVLSQVISYKVITKYGKYMYIYIYKLCPGRICNIQHLHIWSCMKFTWSSILFRQNRKQYASQLGCGYIHQLRHRYV